MNAEGGLTRYRVIRIHGGVTRSRCLLVGEVIEAALLESTTRLIRPEGLRRRKEFLPLLSLIPLHGPI